MTDLPPPPAPHPAKGTTMAARIRGWRFLGALLLAAVLAGGCVQTGLDPGPTAPDLPTPSDQAAAPTRAPGPSAAAGPSAGATQRPSPSGDQAAERPPVAWLAVEGGDPVEGELGSFTWRDAGSDAPWLDGPPIRVGAGERLTLTLDRSIGIASWTASRVRPGNRDGAGAIAMGEGTGDPIAFDAPPRGTWSVNVDVWFADDPGSAAYYWLITVD